MDYSEIVLALVAVSFGVYYYFTKSFGYWKDRDIPYERPTIFFGNIFQAVIQTRGVGQLMTDIYQKYKKEKVVGIFNFNYPGLLIRDPELVHKVWVTDFNHFADNDIEVDENLDKILSRNMFSQKGERWKRTRQQLSPGFTVGKMKPIFDRICNVGDQLREYIGKHPEEIQIKDLMAKFTTEIVAYCGLGIDGHSFKSDDPQLVKMGKLIFEPSTSKGLVQLAVFIAPTLTKLFRMSMIPQEVPDYFDNLLRDVIQYRKASKEKGTDIIQYWIDMQRKSLEVAEGNIKSDVIDRVFTDEDILAGCITFFVEGYETSSMVASFVLYELAVHPEVQEKVHREIDEVLKVNKDKLSFEGVSEMPYLNNVIMETLRLHPAIFHSTKRCTKTYAMDIGKDKPLVIEEGMTIVLPTLGLHIDPAYWDDPLQFKPERFTEDDKGSRMKGTFLPFGDGPRICIGMRMAMLFIKIGLISALRDHKVVPSARTPVEFEQDPRHFMSCQKGGMYARFEKRNI